MDSNPLPPPQSPSQRPLRQVADSEPRPGSSTGVSVGDSSSSPRHADVSAPPHASGKKRKASTLTVTSGDEINLTTEWTPSEDTQPSSAASTTPNWTTPSTIIPLTQSWSESATFASSRALPSLTSPPISVTSGSPFAGKLCTRKPLDRPPPIKRSRANSLPTPRPVQSYKTEDVDRLPKRPKLSRDHLPQLMLPSETRTHTLLPSTKSSRACSSRPHQPLAGPSSAHLKSKKSAPLTKCTDLGTWIPMRTPPITLTTLSTLEAAEILRSPQLRHDLLFDNLAFRPLSRGTNGTLENSVRGRLASTLYWRAVKIEIDQGCRCVRWEKLRNVHASEDSMAQRPMLPCVCGRWMKGATEDDWNRSLKVWPSRLPNLIKSLREIVLSLMAATTPCTSTYQNALDPSKALSSPPGPPLTTHALVPELYAALDSWYILNQARHHSFDVSIFQKLGAAMKVHCAPVRDKMVDDMVTLATVDGKITEALQGCFDCVEVMKLDIANHQLQVMRPWLISTAIEYEFSQFEAALTKSGKDIKSSKTIAWVRECVQAEVAKLPEGDARDKAAASLMPKQTYDAERVKLIIRGYANGMMDLVFGEGVGTEHVKSGMPWSSSSLSDGAIRYAHPQPNRLEADEDKCPESLRLDAMRFAGFHTDIIDITVLNMLLLGYGQVCRSRGGPSGPDALLSMRSVIADFLPNPSGHFYIHRDRRDAEWFRITGDLCFAMATRAVAGEGAQSDEARAAAVPAVREGHRTLLQWVTDNLEPEAALFKTLLSRVRKVIQGALVLALENPIAMRKKLEAAAEEPTSKFPSATAIRQSVEEVLQRALDDHSSMQIRYGLEPLSSEVEALKKRLVRVAMFNLQVYGPTYESAFDS